MKTMTIQEIAEVVRHDYGEIDKVIGRAIEQHSDSCGRRPTCEGCQKPGCCYQAHYMTLYEGIALATYLDALGVNKPGYRAKLREFGERQEAMGIDEWFDTNTPCIFLDNDNRCTVYPVRPVGCRNYHVWSPGELCMPPTKDGIETISIPMIAQIVGTQTSKLCKDLGLDYERRFYVATTPRMAALIMEALSPVLVEQSARAFRRYIERQEFPDGHLFPQWKQGDNPFGRRRKREAGGG